MEDNRFQSLADLVDSLAGEHPPFAKHTNAHEPDPDSNEVLVNVLRDARRRLQAPPTGQEALDLSQRLEVVAARLAEEVRDGGRQHVSLDPVQTTARGLRSQETRRESPFSFSKTQSRPWWRRTVTRVALGGSLLAAALVFLVTHVTDSGPQREHITGKGARATIRLVDGTTVTLGASSRLRYQSLTGRGERAVYLDGEGYFDVAPNSNAPFVVYTTNAATQVLGTEFSVRQYADDSVAQIVVTSGKVAFRPRLGAGGTGVTLIRGDIGRIDNAGLATVAHNVNTESYTSWTRGTLTFPNTTLRDAIRDIERWYDLKITLADPALASAALTGTLTARSGQEAIERIANALNLRVSQQGQSITLFPAGSH